MRGKKEQISGSKGFSRFLAVFVALIMVLSSVNTAGPAKVVRAEDGGGQGTSLSIKASKVFDGGTLTAGQFTFQILDGDKLIATASNDAAGNIAFDEITFAKAGTYTYTIKEVLPEGVNAENKIKDGIEYDTDARTLVVTVDKSLSITSVTLNGQAQTVETEGSTSGTTSSPLVSNVTVYADVTRSAIGYYTEEDELIPLRVGSNFVYCIDDDVTTPTIEGQDFTEFSPADSKDLDADAIKELKKLLYFGAPNDGGTNEITNWIINEGSKLYNSYQSYDQNSAMDELEFVTNKILYGITNEKNDYSPVRKEYEILGVTIDRNTGDYINNALGRYNGGVITVYDEVAQRLWKKVLDPSTDYVTDLVTLHFYTYDGSPDRGTTMQRVVGADIVQTKRCSVSLVAPFANNAAVEPENPTVEISKTSTTDTAELPGAELVIKKKGSDDIVAQHTTTEETWKVQLAPGEYTLTEITAPDGYEIAESIDFTVDENGLVGSDKVHMEDAPTPEEPEKPTVEISKTAVAGSEELPGAKLVITKKGTDEVVAEHITTTETWKVQMAPGEYTLTEITAPEGYEIAESIDFTVDENGLVGSDKVHMEDAPTPEEPEKPTVEISKTAVAGSEELPGAKLVITKRGTKEVVAEHITTTETWKVQLEPGEYTLTEITAPDGYEIAESIDFTVDENGLVGSDKVHMEDAPTPDEPELPEEPVDDEPEEPGDEEPEEPDNEEPGEIPPVPGEEEEEVQPSSEGPSEEHSESTPESSEVENTSETPSEPVENESETPSQPEETTPEESTPEEPVDNESETPSQPEESGTEETEEPETVPPVEEETTAPVENESEAPTEPSQTAPTAPAVPGTTTPSLPDTGDHSNIGLYIGLLGFAAVGTGLLVATRRKKEEE